MAAIPKRQRLEGVASDPPGCLMMGTGEYTTGFVGGEASKSDKSTGVVGIVCLDLKCALENGRLRINCGIARAVPGRSSSSNELPNTRCCHVPYLPYLKSLLL